MTQEESDSLTSDLDKIELKQTKHDDFENATKNNNPPDGGWGWVVCLTSMICNGTVFSILNTFSILYTFLLLEYARDDPVISFKTSFVGSVCLGLTFLTNIASSILCDKIGLRPTALIGALFGMAGLISGAFVKQLELLYLTFGVLLGIGGGLIYSPSLVILGHYFKKRLGLVNGLVTFGSSLYSIVLSVVLPLLLKTIKIKFTFLVLAAMYFTLILCALAWKPLIFRKKSKIKMQKEHSTDQRNKCCAIIRNYVNIKVFSNKGYRMWSLSMFISMFGYFPLLFHLVKHANDVFPNDDAHILITCSQITSAIGRLSYGFLSDFKWANRVFMQQLSLVVMGIMFNCIPLSPNFGGLIATNLFLGFSDGACICLVGTIAFDLVDKEHAAQAIGFLLGMLAVPFTIGPPLIGYLYDMMGTYRVAFHLGSTPIFIGACLMFFVPQVQLPHQRDSSENVSSEVNDESGPTSNMLELKNVRNSDSFDVEENKLINASN